MAPSLSNGRLCYCPGENKTFTCNVLGGILTEWSGTSFDCPTSSNAISLIHDRIEDGTAIGICTNGALSISNTSVNTSASPNCYTSVLSATVSSNMDGQTVQCARDGTSNVIGSFTLRVAGIFIVYTL